MYITYLEGVPINFVTVLANAHNYSKMGGRKKTNEKTNDTKEQAPYQEGVESGPESDQSEIPDLRRRRGGRQKSKAQVKVAAKVAEKSRQGARQRGNEGSIQESSEQDQFGALDRDALNPAARKFVSARTPDSRRPVEAVARDDSIQAVARDDSGEGNAAPDIIQPEFTPYRSVGGGVRSAARALQTLRAESYTEQHIGKSYYSQGVFKCLKGISFYMVKVYYIHLKVFCIYLYKYILYLYHIK